MHPTSATPHTQPMCQPLLTAYPGHSGPTHSCGPTTATSDSPPMTIHIPRLPHRHTYTIPTLPAPTYMPPAHPCTPQPAHVLYRVPPGHPGLLTCPLTATTQPLLQSPSAVATMHARVWTVQPHPT